MSKQHIRAIIDTETAMLDNGVYDVAVVFAQGDKIIDRINYLIGEVYTNRSLMSRAFYHEKMFSQYPQMMSDGLITLCSWADFREEFRDKFVEYNVRTVEAYNAGFDIRVLRATGHSIMPGKTLLPHKVRILCLWEASCYSFMQAQKYKNWCRQHGYVTEKGNISTGAEAAYAYLTQNPSFVEDHTALSDALIEHQISERIRRRKKKLPLDSKVKGGHWQVVNNNKQGKK